MIMPYLVIFGLLFLYIILLIVRSNKKRQDFHTHLKSKRYENETKRVHRKNYVENNLYEKWKKRDNFFSQQELQFYKKLLLYAESRDIFIHSKVRIADLVKPRYQLGNSEFMKVFLKLSQKHVDFVVTNYRWSILCVIELDGSSHNYWKTLKNDAFKNEFFRDAWLPLIRFQNYTHHNLSKLDTFIQ